MTGLLVERLSYAELEAENASLRRAIEGMNASLWARDELRHDFAAIHDDRCPSCSGPIELVDVGRGLVLKATRL